MLHLTSIAHHRNGVCGVSFHVVLFKNGRDLMLGIKFDNGDDVVGNQNKNEVYTAVFDVAKLAAGDIAFGSNSFRGDEFDSAIRVWGVEYEAKREQEYRKNATLAGIEECVIAADCAMIKADS